MIDAPKRQTPKMRLVRCTRDYWEFVRALRTDPRTCHGFVQQVEISPEQQEKYMTCHWHEYFIALVENVPAGFVSSIDDDIRVCTHPDFQRRGVAKFMVNELMQKFPRAFAKIKVDNEASRRLFQACGFRPAFEIYLLD